MMKSKMMAGGGMMKKMASGGMPMVMKDGNSIPAFEADGEGTMKKVRWLKVAWLKPRWRLAVA